MLRFNINLKYLSVFSDILFCQVIYTFQFVTLKMRQEIAMPKLPYLKISRREPRNLSINYFCSLKLKLLKKYSSGFAGKEKWERDTLTLIEDTIH